MVNSKAKEFTILWIDHEKEKLTRFLKKIGERDCGEAHLRKLEDICQFIGVNLNLKHANYDRQALHEIEKVRTSTGNLPDIVFVDIHLGPPNTTGENRAVNKGLSLASKLKKEFPQIPIGLYTAFHLMNSMDKIKISIGNYAAVLENIIDLSEGQNEVILTGNQWIQVFRDIVEVAQNERSKMPLSLSASKPPSIAHWSEKQPFSRSLGFLRAAPELVTRTLEHLPDVSSIRMSQISGGFSGSYLVKAEIEGTGASFVVKIDESPQKLVAELRGHHIVESRVYHKHFLSLSGNYRSEPAMLTEDWWGAFAMSYEVDAKPMIGLRLDGPELENLYTRVWRECLFDLYGDTVSNEVRVAEIYGEDIDEHVTRSWDSLVRYRKRFGQSHVDATERFIERIAMMSTSRLLTKTLNIPWVKHVHGDLNCRNILYSKEYQIFRLLDFPHVEFSDALAVDFVKAEAELLLLMADWSTGLDCDFERIEIWKRIITAFSSEFNPILVPFGDDEADRIATGIKTIRSIYLERASDHGEVELAYRLYLFSRLLKYLNYADLTVSKRHFAFLWASQAFDALSI